MEIGILTAVFRDRPLAEALDLVQSYGVRHVELGSGGYTGNHHCDPDRLLADLHVRARFEEAVQAGHPHQRARLPRQPPPPRPRGRGP